MESLAERARAAVDDRPFLRHALAAGVVNYAAAARALDVDSRGEGEDAIAAALRRYADELAVENDARSARVTMASRLGETDEAGSLSVGGTSYAEGEGSFTGVLATGDVDTRALAAILARLDAADITPDAAGVAGDTLLVVVPRRDGPHTVRLTETALDTLTRIEEDD